MSRPILLRGALMDDLAPLAPETRVRFPVAPPLARQASDRGGTIIRLADADAYIECHLSADGTALVVRCPGGALNVELRDSSQIVVRMRDDERGDRELVATAPEAAAAFEAAQAALPKHQRIGAGG